MTDEEIFTKALVCLQKFKVAVQAGEDTDSIYDEIVALKGQLNVGRDYYRRVDAALLKLENIEAEKAFAQIAEITARMLPLAEGFWLATEIAEHGKKNLFFPNAAAYLTQVNGLIQELKDAAKKMKAGAGNIAAIVSGAELDSLLDDAGKIKAELDGFRAEVQGIRNLLG